MIKVKRAIIVEGKYDKIKLSQFVDGIIIQTDGFRIFKDKQKRQLIKSLAESAGLVVITDSDTAGFKIRNYIKSFTANGDIKNLYIPQISGKEKRKAAASKEGTLGVEGIDEDILLEIFEKSGVTADKKEASDNTKKITKAELYKAGLIGKQNSRKLRLELLKHLGLPEYLSANALADIINIYLSYDEFFTLSAKLGGKQEH